MPDLCWGGLMSVGQPGQMMFAARVYSDGTQPITFRSHYNVVPVSVAGSWSASTSVTTSGTTCSTSSGPPVRLISG